MYCQARLTWDLSTPGTYPIASYRLIYEDLHDPRPCGAGSTTTTFAGGRVQCHLFVTLPPQSNAGAWTVDGLNAGHRYHFYVDAIDVANNYNAASGGVYWSYHQHSAGQFSTPAADLASLSVAFNQPVATPRAHSQCPTLWCAPCMPRVSTESLVRLWYGAWAGDHPTKRHCNVEVAQQRWRLAHRWLLRLEPGL